MSRYAFHDNPAGTGTEGETIGSNNPPPSARSAASSYQNGEMIDAIQKEPRKKFQYQYKPQMAFNTAVAQVALSLGVFAGGLISVFSQAHHHETGACLWCGVFFGITGFFGVTTANRPNAPRLITGYLLLNAASMVFSVVVLWTGAEGANVEGRFIDGHRLPSSISSRGVLQARVAAHLLMTVCGTIMLIASFAATANCCREICFHQRELRRQENVAFDMTEHIRFGENTRINRHRTRYERQRYEI